MISDASAERLKPGFALSNIGVAGVVVGVPKRCVGNESFFGAFGEKAVTEVTAVTGVNTRHWAASQQTTSDLCFEAAEILLARTGWARETVDALIFVSQTPDQRLPATACVLHGRLGLSTHCQAFDVGLGCSGYVYGLWLASALIAAGCRRVLVLAGDTSSKMLDSSDRSTALLFGDAGSATAVERRPGANSYFVLGSDGTGARNLIVPAGGFREPLPDSRIRQDFDPSNLFMDGSEVFSFTLRAVPRLVRDTLAAANAQISDVDAFLMHQANRFMLRHIAKKLAIPAERMPINIDRFGNTSSASIPLLLTTDFAEKAKTEKSRVMMVGFGVGYSWGAAYLELDHLACAEMVLV